MQPAPIRLIMNRRIKKSTNLHTIHMQHWIESRIRCIPWLSCGKAPQGKSHEVSGGNGGGRPAMHSWRRDNWSYGRKFNALPHHRFAMAMAGDDGGRGANRWPLDEPPTLFSLLTFQIKSHFGELVQNFELRRVGGAPKGYQLTPLTNS